MRSIRGKAIVVIEHNNKFLFTVCTEEATGKTFYIPVGGGIEFGEKSIDAAKREAAEEINQEIENIQLLDILENIFTYNAINEHEIVFVYKADLKNKNAYHNLHGNENGHPMELTWASLDEIKEKETHVYPFKLIEILDKLKG